LLVSLVGLPGSGKSTVGRQLARRLQTSYLDSDNEIEVQVGCTIPQFFEQKGEGRFREVEAKVLDSLTANFCGVLSTGGGAVLNPLSRRYLRDRSTVIYLKSTPEELIRRLRHDVNRPLLQVADPMSKLRELFAERSPLYHETAHFVLETGRPSVATLVNMIVMQLELAGVVKQKP
jgi:shikimate kinase